MKISICLSLFFFIFFNIESYGQNNQDAHKALVICDIGEYKYFDVKGYGNDLEKFEDLKCISQNFHETNSKWLKWTIEQKGTLEFIISPNQPNDDLDFILFKTNENGDPFPVRCMISGANIGSDYNFLDNCAGSTGLKSGKINTVQGSGCNHGDSNFLKDINVYEGDEFLLLVNNFDSNFGFNIEFSGSSSFLRSDDCVKSKPQSFQIVDFFPNPVSEILNMRFSCKKESQCNIKIYSISGTLVSETEFKVFKGSRMYEINVENLSRGSYLVKSSIDENFEISKIIK